MDNEILVELFGDDADPEEQDRMAKALRRELLEIDAVDAVAPAQAGPAPPGAKGVDLAAIGALVVTIQPTLELLGKVVRAAKAWLDRKPAGAAPRSMRVTINGQTIEFLADKQQQDEVLAAFLAEATKAKP